MTATTAAFDPAVTAATGDLWLESVDPTPHSIPWWSSPARRVTIPVTFTPSGTPGTTVSGTLYLDDASLIDGGVTENALSGTFPQGSDVAAFAYEYTIG